MDKTRDRPLKRPTVEIAATRNAQVLQRQQHIQRMLNVTVVCAVLTAGYLFSGVGLVVLGLAVLTGIFCGSGIKRLRTFSEQFRLMTVVADSLDEEQANALRIGVKAESRSALARLIVSAVCVFGIIMWVATSEGRLWVVLLCIVSLAYVFSSVKVLSSYPSSFMKLTIAAQEKGCRTVLFRSFEERSSSLARSALAPILAGYGMLDIVLDETLERAESEGVFGLEGGDIGELCKLHRFANAEWKDRVAEIIRDCDIAIIDLTRVSPGVIWELAQSYKHLPPYRIYGVINAGALENRSLKNHMTAFYDTLRTHPEMPANVRPYVFIFVPSAWQQEALANDIHRKMLEIIAIEEGGLDASHLYSGS